MRRLALAGAVLLAAGCGGSHARPLPVLAPGAVPQLASGGAGLLTATDLAHDAPIASLPADLGRWGYRSGTQVSYRGDAPVFSVVTSRTLRFATPAGARAYVAMVGRHASAYGGGLAAVRPVRSGGRRGYMVTAGACGCATEIPSMLVVVSAGRRVTWLEATGRRATPAAVEALVAKAP